MYEVLLYVVNLWDIAESRAWEPKVIPRYYISNALVLTSVSQRWSQFVILFPWLWSYLFIDTNDKDTLEYLQLFLHLSHNHHLFIVLHGRAVMSDSICDRSTVATDNGELLSPLKLANCDVGGTATPFVSL